MRIKKIVCFVIMLMIFAGWPLTSLALGDGNAAVSSSNVSCTVPETYDFTVPDDAVLQYPQTQLYLGEFSVGDILLKSGEKLNIFVTAGQLKKPGSADVVIPYNIIFNAPSDFDSSAAGTSYGIAVAIDEDVFGAAESGTYRGSLLFQVVSNIGGEVVWEKDVVITALRRRGTNTNQQNENTETENNSIQNDNADEIPQNEEFEEESVPQAGGASNEPDKEDDSSDKAEQQADQSELPKNTNGYDSYIIWILAACTVLGIIILVFLLIMKRKKKEV